MKRLKGGGRTVGCNSPFWCAMSARQKRLQRYEMVGDMAGAAKPRMSLVGCDARD